MPTATREITIPTADGGAMAAYVAFPATLPAPVVMMIAAVYGVNEATRGWADRYAESGFIAIAPDFFWRTIPGPLNADLPEDAVKAKTRSSTFDKAAGIRDIEAVRDFSRAMPESNGKWSVAGYCFGGFLTLIAGGTLGADAVVAFHPSRMATALEETARITVPLSFHCGGADPGNPPELLAQLRDALKNNPRAEFDVYPGVVHGFTAPDRAAYDRDAAERSFVRAVAALDSMK